MTDWSGILQAAGTYGAGAYEGVRRAPDGALLLGGLGGVIGFFVAGPVGAMKGVLIGAAAAGQDASSPESEAPGSGSMDVTGQVPRPSDHSPSSRSAATNSVPEPAAPEAAPVAWIASEGPVRTEYASSRPWAIEAEGLRFGLEPGRSYSVGRDQACDIRVQESSADGDTVSRKHASLLVFDDGLYIVDERSSNGTFADDSEIAPGGAVVMRRRFKLQLGRFAIFVAPI